jgi:hypothetical protein
LIKPQFVAPTQEAKGGIKREEAMKLLNPLRHAEFQCCEPLLENQNREKAQRSGRLAKE